MELYFIVQILVQAIVEGITEFLPVSSTGHLILVNALPCLHFEDETFAKTFQIVIQLGAILSVVVYYHDKVLDGVFRFDFHSHGWRLWFKVLPAVIPALIIGGCFGSLVQKYLFRPDVISAMLVIGGIGLLFVENGKFQKRIKSHISDIDSLSYKKSMLIGVFQCLAILLPGTSRSAATIIGAMLLGCSRSFSAEFSFFLAIPTMMAASVYSLMKSGSTLNLFQWGGIGLGFICSFFLLLLNLS